MQRAHTLERQVVGAFATQWILRRSRLSCTTLTGLRTTSRRNRSATKLANWLCRSSTRVHGIGIDVVALIAVDIIEVLILPSMGIDIKPHMNSVALMNIELLQAVCTEDSELTSTRILILRLDDELLRLPRIACTLGDTLLSGIFLDNHSLYFYSL